MAVTWTCCLDVEARCGAGYDEKSPERINSRNGHRERTWDTKLRQGSYLPEFLEPRAELDERVGAFLNRAIEGDWPYLWVDATYVKTREAGRIVSMASEHRPRRDRPGRVSGAFIRVRDNGKGFDGQRKGHGIDGGA